MCDLLTGFDVRFNEDIHFYLPQATLIFKAMQSTGSLDFIIFGISWLQLHHIDKKLNAKVCYRWMDGSEPHLNTNAQGSETAKPEIYG